MVQLKVATKTHIWVDWGTWENPVLSDFIRSATQAQRDHKIIHARNFHVQPQAIMGSSIVEFVAWPLEEVDQQVVGL